jgi:ubiquinone biosynthesis protein
MGLLSGIRLKYKSASRYNEILRVLIKYGFEDLVYYLEKEKRHMWLWKIIPKSSRDHAIKYTKWAKMRLVCEELGPTFVKFGQILSNRPDLVPFDLVFELEKLQDTVPPMPEDVAKQVVEEALEGSVESLFAWFEPKPFASASMAQVHKVILHSGERVALKVQRPGIQEIILEDIKLMYSIAEILEKRIPSIQSFDPVGLVKNFEDSILKELDFIHESINVQRFYNNIAQDEGLDQFAHGPKVYTEFTKEKVLAMDFISGIKIDNIDALEEAGIDKKIVARRLAISYYKQIFEYGFFHADPHPGNLLVLPNSHICYLDFGMMGSILPRDIDVFGQLFLSISTKNVHKIIKVLQRLSSNTTVKDMRKLEYDVNEFVEKYYVRDIHDNELSTVLLELKDIIIAHGLKVPSYFYLFARSLVTLEGVLEKLDPTLEQFEIVRPYLVSSVSKKYDPIKATKSALNSLYEINKYMEEFPNDLKNAIARINSGQIKVDISHKGIDPMVHSLQRVAKQIVTTLIIVALIAGASLFIIKDIHPLWGGISALGIVGLIIAALLGIGLLWNLGKGDYDDNRFIKK